MFRSSKSGIILRRVGQLVEAGSSRPPSAVALRTRHSSNVPPRSSDPRARSEPESGSTRGATGRTRSKYSYSPPTQSYDGSSSDPVSKLQNSESSDAEAARSPRLYSSSGIPTDSHPMPHAMPREDYSSPTVYTMGLISKIIKYLVYGSLGLGVFALVGVEGAHQYVERVSLADISHLDEEYELLLIDPRRPGGDAAMTEADDADFFAWAEENDSWTGGARGGTSSLLSFLTRHALRSAWIAQVVGTGASMASISKDTPSSGSTSAATRGMISRSARSSSSSVNTVDTGYELAEIYVAQAIEKAKQNGFMFPDELSINRSTTPQYAEKGKAAEPQSSLDRESVSRRRVAWDLFIRQAELLERIGTPSALARSSDLYERVLRAMLNASPSAAPSRIEVPTSQGLRRPTRREFALEVREAQILKLVRKIGDVNARLGDDDKAREWWTWGLARSGSQIANASTSTISSDTLTPFKKRALVSLLDSYSTQLAVSGQLANAADTQRQAIALIDSDSSLSLNATSQHQRLHRAWLQARKSLATMHLAEIETARGKQTVEQGLTSLYTSTNIAERVVAELTSTVIRPDDRHLHVQSNALAPDYASSRVLRGPGEQLLRDTQRLNAEAWNLCGLLYERQAVATKQRLPAQEMKELALDCFEKALGWSKISEGSDVRGQHDILGVEEEPSTSSQRAAYLANYVRIKSKIEADLRS